MTNQLPETKDVVSDFNFASITRIPFYFGPEEKQLFGYLHYVKSIPTSNIGLIICPSLGVEYMNAYRPLRYVADYHALAGIPSLRFDYQGTGDSTGLNDEPDRVEAWLSSIKIAYQQLKDLMGCEQIVLFGFRMGATLASLIAERIDVDGLILWAPLENGRRYIREVKTLQMMGSDLEDVKKDNLLEAGGAVFVPDTVASIQKINLIKSLPKANRALIIPRDDLPSSEKLKDSWEGNGISVSQKSWSGYADMVIDAHNVHVPHQTIQRIVKWTVGDSKVDSIKKSQDFAISELAKNTAVLHFNGCLNENIGDTEKIKESIVIYGAKNNRIGILSQPDNNDFTKKPTVILTNSGSNHRVGPNRLYVLLARELSRKGFQCLRIDVAGLGDSVKSNPEEENIVYLDDSTNEIHLAMQSFGENYVDRQYIIMGLCSGSYFSFHAANDLEDVAIAESIMINPLTFYWEEGMNLDISSAQHFSQWNWYKTAFKSPASWWKLLRGQIAFKVLFKTLSKRINVLIHSRRKARESINTPEDQEKPMHNLSFDLLNISKKNTHLSFVLARSDPGHDILFTGAGKVVKKLIKNKKMDIYYIENADHTFSRLKPRCNTINSIVQHLSLRYKS